MRKLLGWLAFIAITIASFILAMTIFIRSTDVVNMPEVLVEYRMEFVFGTTFLVMFPLATKLRRWIAGTKPNSQKATHVR